MTSGAIQYGDPITVRLFMIVSVNWAEIPKSPEWEECNYTHLEHTAYSILT